MISQFSCVGAQLHLVPAGAVCYHEPKPSVGADFTLGYLNDCGLAWTHSSRTSIASASLKVTLQDLTARLSSLVICDALRNEKDVGCYAPLRVFRSRLWFRSADPGPPHCKQFDPIRTGRTAGRLTPGRGRLGIRRQLSLPAASQALHRALSTSTTPSTAGKKPKKSAPCGRTHAPVCPWMKPGSLACWKSNLSHRPRPFLCRPHHPLTRKRLSPGLSRTGEMRQRSRPFTDAKTSLRS